MQKSNEQLINNVIGQLEGIKKMLSGKNECFSVLIQMKAAKASFERVMIQYTEQNLMDCAAKMKVSDKEKLGKLLKEIIKK
ncbi:MAG: metal-sensing transcriptional repressor [Candidatus Moraniibacteriota bacterium]|jgi:DNA-binding FrmR family transcriptional regulator